MGAQMSLSGFFFRRGEKYCHNGGMALAPSRERLAHGSKKAIMAPFGVGSAGRGGGVTNLRCG